MRRPPPTTAGVKKGRGNASPLRTSDAWKLLNREMLRADQLTPLAFVRGDEIRKGLGRACHRLEHLRLQKSFAECGIVQDGCDILVDLAHDLARRPGGREQSEPGARLVAGKPALGHRRYVGNSGEALRAADTENLHLPGAEWRQRGADADRYQTDMSGNDVGERRRGTAIVHGLKL